MTKTRICASRRALHWNSPMSAPQSNLSSWTIERFRKPQIRTGGGGPPPNVVSRRGMIWRCPACAAAASRIPGEDDARGCG